MRYGPFLRLKIGVRLGCRSTPASKLVEVGTILKPCEIHTGLQNSALM